ncbi:MAG: hypothetical protein KatS3mg119_0336 [Rhodothalassiaceae bacterium]|nr:MAG: hypothetical protein KatS3mg119_0336 [Rhodothalassiaceae bacterium]
MSKINRWAGGSGRWVAACALALAGLAAPAARAGETTVSVPDYTMSAAFLQVFQKTQLKLDNYGAKHGDSWLEQQSRLLLPDGRVVTFAIPEVTATVGGVRKWLYYVDELNSKEINVTLHDGDWSKLDVAIPFEDGGHEIKGRCLRKKLTGGWRECTLNIERDMQAVARAGLTLRPRLVDGRVGYELLEVDFESAAYPANALCKVAVIVCNLVTEFHEHAFRAIVRKVLTDEFGRPATIRAVAANVQKVLDTSLALKLEQELGFRPKSWTVKALVHDGDGWRITLVHEDPPPRQKKPRKAHAVATIQKIETVVTPATWRGTCPAKLKVGGYVTTGHATTVTFRVVDDRGWQSNAVTWTFKGPGRHQLYTWRREIAPDIGAIAADRGDAREVTGWYQIEVLAPQQVKGPRAAYRVTCVRPKKATIGPLKPQ